MNKRIALLTILVIVITLSVLPGIECARAAGPIMARAIVIRNEGVGYMQSDNITVDYSKSVPITTVDNKTYTLIDNVEYPIQVEKNDTTVNGMGYAVEGVNGTGVVLDSLESVKICNFTVRGCNSGISVSNCKTIDISDNTVYDCYSGPERGGIIVLSSTYSELSNNTLWNNSDVGIYVSNSLKVNVIDNNVTFSKVQGVGMEKSAYCDILKNNVQDNPVGILLSSQEGSTRAKGQNFTLLENDITNNGLGMWLSNCSYNVLYHNNFSNDSIDVSLQNSQNNTWDDGYPSGGNYWSDYSGVDTKYGPQANETGSDGIGDSPQWVEFNKTVGDHYPLMGEFRQFNNISIIGNCTVSTVNALSFKLNVVSDAALCRVCIPNDILEQPYALGVHSPYTNDTSFDYTIVGKNEAHTWIYFVYPHSGTATVTLLEKGGPDPFWFQWWFWILTGFAIAAVATFKSELARKERRRRRVETDFREDVGRRKRKMEHFGYKYGMDIKPSENLTDAMKKAGIDRQKKK